MSEEGVLKDIWRAKNHWLSIYWCKERVEWSLGWWDAERFGIRLWLLMIVYRPPKARLPEGSQIMSTNGCMAWTIGVAAVVALGLFLLYLYGVSWQIVAGLATSAVIFGLCLAITVAILDWRVE